MEILYKDRTLLRHAETELKEFLLSDQLFWPLNDSERLTLGSLLLALTRAQGLAKTYDEIQLVERIGLQLSDVRSTWRTNWSNKAALEFRSRLRQWELVVRDLLSREQKQNITYAHEVTLRVLMALLQPEILEPDVTALENLAILDRRLSTECHKSEFVWDPELMAQFPKDKFWFLYCYPNPETRQQ